MYVCVCVCEDALGECVLWDRLLSLCSIAPATLLQFTDYTTSSYSTSGPPSHGFRAQASHSVQDIPILASGKWSTHK